MNSPGRNVVCVLLDRRSLNMAIQFCLHGSARSVQEAVDRAERAEAVGFEAIFFADSHMNNVDPYQVMAMCAENEKDPLRHGGHQYGLSRSHHHRQFLRHVE